MGMSQQMMPQAAQMAQSGASGSGGKINPVTAPTPPSQQELDALRKRLGQGGQGAMINPNFQGAAINPQNNGMNQTGRNIPPEAYRPYSGGDQFGPAAQGGGDMTRQAPMLSQAAQGGMGGKGGQPPSPQQLGQGLQQQAMMQRQMPMSNQRQPQAAGRVPPQLPMRGRR